MRCEPDSRKLWLVDPEGVDQPANVVGRYVVHDHLASGGMASVHIGRLIGPVGFSRTVAVKILHPQYARDPQFVSMFIDEARLAARIRHPNVVATLDVVATNGQLMVVMEYVAGETLARLLTLCRGTQRRLEPAIASAILVDVLDGLHAAHEARDERDEPLDIVHRDVSPQNVMVGADGTARVLDFGIAKAASREHSTNDGAVKGKFPYMAPEQISRQKVDRRTDVFAAAIVLWEALTGERLFHADHPAAIVARVMNESCAAPSMIVEALSPEVDGVVLKGLARDRDSRFATAHDFARALEKALPPARRSEVRAWVEQVAHDVLTARARRVTDIERGGALSPRLASVPEVLTTPGGPSAIPVTLADSTDGTGSTSTTGDTRRSRRTLLSYVGGVAVVASLLTFIALRRPPAPGAAASFSPPATTDIPATGAPDANPSSTVVSATPAPLPPPEATSTPPAAAASPASRHGQSIRAQKACDPPYTFTDAGVKRWKHDCL